MPPIRRLAALLAVLTLAGASAGHALGQDGSWPPRTELIITAGCYGVEIGGRCINDPTPQQRAQADEEKRLRQEKLDRERRERERLAAEHKAKVDAVVQRLGPQRRNEAERFVAMQEAAAAARPKPIGAAAQQRSCSTTTTQEPRKDVFLFMSGDKQNYKAEGRAEMLRQVAQACEGGVMTGFDCKGGGAIGFFSCPTTFTCPVRKTVCTGPTGSRVSPQ